MRRRPDSRWRLTAERLGDLIALQAELLDTAAALLEPDGLLVYATCSIEPEENEQQVDQFLARHEDFERDTNGPSRGQDLFVAPWEQNTDGAYASRLRKRRGG
jgi:16S rRNA (cytosine967-C5)-methyltransferase